MRMRSFTLWVGLTLAVAGGTPALADDLGWTCQIQGSSNYFLDRFASDSGNVGVYEGQGGEDDDCRGFVADPDTGWVEVHFGDNPAGMDFEFEVNLDDLDIPIGRQIHLFTLFPGDPNAAAIVELHALRSGVVTELSAEWSDDNGTGSLPAIGVLARGDRVLRVSWTASRTQPNGAFSIWLDGNLLVSLENLLMGEGSFPARARVGLIHREPGVTGEMTFRPTRYTWHFSPTG